MRWGRRTEYVSDTERIVWQFLLLPRKLAGEWRWLELAGIRQTKLSLFVYVYWLDHSFFSRSPHANFGTANLP